jgi:hypothetical protein
MIKASWLAGCMIFFVSATAQNLVRNPSFETYSICPGSTSQLTCSFWYVSQNSPDYFNVCSGSGASTGVPENVCGTQSAASGVAYTGILCYGIFSPTYVPEGREYITGELTTPLVPGTRYYVSFKVSRSEMCSHAIDHLGAKFLTSAPDPLAISNNAQIVSTAVISDQNSWTLISGSFVADAAYTYISIGNHYSDALTTVNFLDPVTLGYNAYYYIDDVCVSTVPSTCSVSILPVQLLSFETTCGSSGVLLSWKTASETNNDHFEIERSFNAAEFETIGRVNGNGTTSSVNSYSFTDADYRGSVVYYRLKQVDNNGELKYSAVRMIVCRNNSVQLYYEGENGKIVANFLNADNNHITLQIIDMNGRMLRNSMTNNSHLMEDVNGLSSGVYVVRLITNRGTYFLKFIKQ